MLPTWALHWRQPDPAYEALLREQPCGRVEVADIAIRLPRACLVRAARPCTVPEGVIGIVSGHYPDRTVEVSFHGDDPDPRIPEEREVRCDPDDLEVVAYQGNITPEWMAGAIEAWKVRLEKEVSEAGARTLGRLPR